MIKRIIIQQITDIPTILFFRSSISITCSKPHFLVDPLGLDGFSPVSLYQIFLANEPIEARTHLPIIIENKCCILSHKKSRKINGKSFQTFFRCESVVHVVLIMMHNVQKICAVADYLHLRLALL